MVKDSVKIKQHPQNIEPEGTELLGGRPRGAGDEPDAGHKQLR